MLLDQWKLWIKDQVFCICLLPTTFCFISLQSVNYHLKCKIFLSGNNPVSQHEALKKYYLTTNKKAVFIGECYSQDDETLVRHQISSKLWKIQDKNYVCMSSISMVET